MDYVNETIELDHDVEGMEEVLNLPRDKLEALNRESEGSKLNIEETEVINLVNEGEKKKKPRQDRGKLSQRHERRAHSSTERIQEKLCLVLSRYARTRYRDRRPQDSS